MNLACHGHWSLMSQRVQIKQLLIIHELQSVILYFELSNSESQIAESVCNNYLQVTY